MVEACCVRREGSESASWREDLAAGRKCKRAYSRVLLLMRHAAEGEEEWNGETEVREGEEDFGVMLVERREGHPGCGKSC